MSKVISEIADLEKEMSRVLKCKARQVERIDKALKSLESEEERTALTMRYINRVSVSEIAEAMGYSEQRIYQFMNQGGAQIAKQTL
jgi:RNA polymerase sigma factor (sigma-70 family)